MKTWIKLLLAIGTIAVLSAVSIFGISALRANQEAAEQARIAAEEAAQQEAELDALAIKFASPAPVEATKAPPPPPEPVVEEPVYEEPVYEEPAYVPGQSGDYVPFIPSDDPNNALGGDYIDPGLYCLNGSASGNPPICD